MTQRLCQTGKKTAMIGIDTPVQETSVSRHQWVQFRAPIAFLNEGFYWEPLIPRDVSLSDSRYTIFQNVGYACVITKINVIIYINFTFHNI